MSAESAAAAEPEHTFLERILDGIERFGNKMPDPAILFLILCGIVIVLSQILFWFNVKATFEVVKPPPVPTEETYYGGSVEPTDVGPTEPVPPKDYKVVTETAKVKAKELFREQETEAWVDRWRRIAGHLVKRKAAAAHLQEAERAFATEATEERWQDLVAARRHHQEVAASETG